MLPRYITIAAELREDILSGKYSIGSRLPTEAHLSTNYRASRSTIREAFRVLTDMGLVQSRQGARTTVISTSSTPEYRAEFSTLEETIDFAHDYSPRYLEVLEEEIIEAGRSLARFLKCRPGRRWRVLRGPRRDGQTDAVVAHCELFLWAELEGHSFDRSRTIAGQISDQYSLDITEIKVELSAISLSQQEAATLESKMGHPGLQVVRRFIISPGRPFEVVRNVFEGELVNYALTFRKRDAGVV